MAEEYGLIDGISWIVLEKVCEFLGANPALPLKTVSVNMTGQQILDPIFIRRIEQNLEKYRVKGERLRIEITERTVTDDFAEVKKVMESLAQKGIRFYLDDFGTGYSSLNMLRNLPIDVLKLDRGFIKDTIQDTKGQIVTKSIIEMANKLNMLTVAEGIETEEQAEFLRSIGCKIAQGFLYGKPVDIKSFTELFINKSQADAQA